MWSLGGVSAMQMLVLSLVFYYSVFDSKSWFNWILTTRFAVGDNDTFEEGAKLVGTVFLAVTILGILGIVGFLVTVFSFVVLVFTLKGTLLTVVLLMPRIFLFCYFGFYYYVCCYLTRLIAVALG